MKSDFSRQTDQTESNNLDAIHLFGNNLVQEVIEAPSILFITNMLEKKEYWHRNC